MKNPFDESIMAKMAEVNAELVGAETLLKKYCGFIDLKVDQIYWNGKDLLLLVNGVETRFREAPFKARLAAFKGITMFLEIANREAIKTLEL